MSLMTLISCRLSYSWAHLSVSKMEPTNRSHTLNEAVDSGVSKKLGWINMPQKIDCLE